VVLLSIGLGVVFLGKTGGPAEEASEKWNSLTVFPEADVEKSPLLYSHEYPKPKLEPGRVVSVTVSWIVTPEGLVDDPKIVVSASPEIDAFVVEAVRKWRYEPGQKDGKTVPVRVLRKYTFGQRGGSEGS
jgi:TonB family protein